MKHRQRAQSSSLFLMELILTILFFSITSAVCVQLFVKSHLLSQESQVLTLAVNECSSVAEISRTADSISEALGLITDEYPENVVTSSSDNHSEISLFYDDCFDSCSRASQVYSLTISLQQKDDMILTDLDVCKVSDHSSIYQLHTQHHIARRTGYER